ncbi:MAG: hypothetical protein HFE46_02445 [Clostridia bacterium]|nr:hypothetical protein [Clostridia bacterium]
MYEKMQTVDLGEIKPHGWVKEFLQTQANGLTGKLQHTGYPYSIAFWKGETNGNETPPWEVFEQTAYRLDGMYSCGALIGRDDLCAYADESFAYALAHIAPDGFIGSDVLRQTDGWHRWPQVVFFRALIAKYEYSHDESILCALRDFYTKGKYDYSTKRDFLHIEIMLWVYGITGDTRLLVLAEKTYADYNANCTDDNSETVMLSDKQPYVHGVTHDETAKIGAILYMHTGNARYLQTSVNAFEKLDKMFMLPDGGHCSNEFMIGNDSYQSHETCTITDYTWALYYLLAATGDVKYADKIEKCIFNAGIGAVNEDFTAVQYFSCPNQTVAAQNTNHNTFFCGEQWMAYNAKHNTDCCVGNVNRFMPNFVRRLWMRKENEIYATLYSPNTFSFELNGARVRIEEKTNYPFEDTVTFAIHTDKAVKFALNLRIPAWSGGATLAVNGAKRVIKESGAFYRIEREFADGDEIALTLQPQVVTEKSSDGGVHFTRGPLVFALGLSRKEHKVPAAGGDGALCNYNYTTTDKWNYCVKEKECSEKEMQLVRCDLSVQNPWSLDGAPLKLFVPAHRLAGWELLRKTEVTQCRNLYEKEYSRKTGDFVFTPPLPEKISESDVGEKETISLVPMGAAKLRVTVFPVSKL